MMGGINPKPSLLLKPFSTRPVDPKVDAVS